MRGSDLQFRQAILQSEFMADGQTLFVEKTKVVILGEKPNSQGRILCSRYGNYLQSVEIPFSFLKVMEK
jgi:hypothetical protein